MKAGDELVLKEQKTGKTWRVTINAACVEVLQALVLERLSADATVDSPLFVTAKRGNRLGICDLSRMWKHWFALAGLDAGGAAEGVRACVGIDDADLPVHPA